MTDPLIYLNSVIDDARGDPKQNLQVRAEYIMQCRDELAYRREAMRDFGKIFDPRRSKFPRNIPNWITVSAPQSPTPNSYVYFIMEEGDDRFVKIGRARNIQDRLTMLQTGNPRLLKVMRKIPGAERVESWMKDRFSPLKIRSEWHLVHEDMITAQPPDNLV